MLHMRENANSFDAIVASAAAKLGSEKFVQTLCEAILEKRWQAAEISVLHAQLVGV